MVESWFILALCRFSLGICIYSFLSSLIFKKLLCHTSTMYQIPVESGKFSEYYLWFTIVEVILGILKPDSLHLSHFLGLSLLNWIFYGLTIYKAYYIVYAFMHMEVRKAL
jgi:hypothetical protein